MPFSFASHFSPENTLPALERYRHYFEPSAVLDKPYAMVGVNVVAADTTEEAKILSTTHQQQFLSLNRNTPSQIQPPVETMEGIWNPFEKESILNQLKSTIIGNPQEVKEKLQAFLEETGADEMIINSTIYDHKARLRSYEIVAEVTGMKS